MKNSVAAGLLLAMMVSTSLGARAQNGGGVPARWGSWVIGTVQLPGASRKHWGGFAETQARSEAVGRQFFYHELKGGVSYDVTRGFTVLLGGGRYVTTDYRDRDAGPLIREGRLWGQLVLSQQARRLKLEHRYRVERRWFRFRDDSTATGVRLRYRLNAFVPLNAKTITAGIVFVSAYDEIFLNPRGPVLERNRVYAGLGYQFNKHLTAQAGWVNQANYTQPTLRGGQFVPRSTAAKNNVVLTLTYRLVRRPADDGTPQEQQLPSQQD